jgi:oligoribonuclease (3'-5' exoribonuclease)
MHPEVERAIDDILNEAIVVEDKQDIIQIDLEQTGLSPNLKKIITNEFKNILKLLDFNKNAFEIFRRWYIDGRLYYHIIIDVTSPNDGIKELRYVDPRKLRKIKEVRTRRDKKSQNTSVEKYQEYFVYNDRGFQNKAGEIGTNSAVQGLRIAPDSIVHITSGIVDPNNTVVLSHLHKAIKPLNQLRALEDATVVYRISRAPERLIFYIDVGNLPKMKAEQYLRDMMIRHKNKIVYDAATGEVRDDRKFMTMLENYWLPRREGNRGTEITTLPAGQNLGELADVEYFQKNLFMSLNVPVSRLQQETTFNFGGTEEISRDELKFLKFIDRLRSRFNETFLIALGKQVILKNIMLLD